MYPKIRIGDMLQAVIDYPDARVRLERFHPVFIESYLAAWASWLRFISLEGQTDLAKPLSTTTRANFIHDHVQMEFETRIEGVEDIQSIPKTALDSYMVKLGPDILLRFKFTQYG